MATSDPVTARVDGPLDLTMMLAIHSAFRRDLAHLARAAGRYRTDDPGQRTALLAGWEVFKTQLHTHHSGEDADLWPRMRARLADRPDDLALLQAMQDEHARIDPLVATVDGALADHGDGHHRLGDTVDALTTELTGHLAHEERDALPLVNRSLTRAGWRAFEDSQRRKTGLRGAAEFLPWLLDGTPAEQAQAVLHRMPPPVRLVYRRIWQPRYARRDRWEPSTR